MSSSAALTNLFAWFITCSGTVRQRAAALQESTCLKGLHLCCCIRLEHLAEQAGRRAPLRLHLHL